MNQEIITMIFALIAAASIILVVKLGRQLKETKETLRECRQNNKEFICQIKKLVAINDGLQLQNEKNNFKK